MDGIQKLLRQRMSHRRSDDFEKFLENLSNGTPDGQLPGPSTAHLAFIPQCQKSNALVMRSEAPSEIQKVMPTVFIGTIRPNYTSEMWQADLMKWKTHFKNLLAEYVEISLVPLQENYMIMDSTQAIPQIEKSLVLINQLPPGGMIRIVCLGTGFSKFLYEAITYLLKEWREPSGELRTVKHLQFITSGDTENRDLSDFCQWLCISGTCQVVCFYNTMMYHPFGYAHSQYQHRD